MTKRAPVIPALSQRRWEVEAEGFLEVCRPASLAHAQANNQGVLFQANWKVKTTPEAVLTSTCVLSYTLPILTPVAVSKVSINSNPGGLSLLVAVSYL